MGAERFITFAGGSSAAVAFKTALRSAHRDYGTAGYTGTIAEKSEFQFVDPPENLKELNHYQLETWIKEKMDNIDYKDPPFWDDKWGPAACMKVGETDFYFFGWSST